MALRLRVAVWLDVTGIFFPLSPSVFISFQTCPWNRRELRDGAHLQPSPVITTQPCVLWVCEPVAHQKHHVPLGELIRQAGLGAEGWICSYLLPRPPRMALLKQRGAPHWPPGYRGSEISRAPHTLYLSRASAVGMDGSGLAQGGKELLYISHS